MPLPAERTRLEWSLRAIALVALGLLLLGAFREPRRDGGRVIQGSEVTALHGWGTSPPADTLGIALRSTPGRLERDYLRALRRNGTVVAWTGESLASVMVDAEPLMDPSRETMIRIAGAPPGLVILRDSLGLLDSVRNAGPGTTLRIPVVGGMIGVASGSTRATAGAERSQVTRSVVVLGLAGWEAKFVIRALEERGWTVDARLAIAPRLGTVQGRPFPLDTARHAAVIALDSTAASYARELLGYVRSGGGVILGEGASSRVPALALAGYGGNTRPSRTRGFNSEGKELLGFRHLSNLREGAATLESRNGNVVLAALRLGAGRVVQSGYRDTWRWRMEGGEKGVESHRAWWASLVATVAHRSQGAAPLGDPAPLTSLILSSGPATTLPERHATPVVWPFLLGLTVLALYAEWFLRRMRGAG